ncbi:hypothetical protein AVEN_242704-1 [Araneus ventricosus]|uniref:Uncharacterized protein n=1 Tax=Araneus ventricosus TaxID=182803 RepID=A0A4Y2E128_ARAVE|nr:hypothetical protein AVEN_242704-1 [Araneus ventricosus]
MLTNRPSVEDFKQNSMDLEIWRQDYTFHASTLFLSPVIMFTERMPPHVPVTATFTVVAPVGWTWEVFRDRKTILKIDFLQFPIRCLLKESRRQNTRNEMRKLLAIAGFRGRYPIASAAAITPLPNDKLLSLSAVRILRHFLWNSTILLSDQPWNKSEMIAIYT